MIKFFRKIRQKLLTENRFSKYMLYAIGEIILVIIGILFALQINNWNETNKTETDLNNSLHAMINELNENIRFISYVEKSMQNRISGIQKITDKTATVEEQKDVLNVFGQSANSNPFNKIYELLKDEKKLQLIGDDTLVKRISDFYEYDLRSIDDFCSWHKGFVGDNIDPYILENIPMEDFKVEPEILNNLLKQVKFRNILSYQKLLYESYVASSKYALESAENLITEIENYLSNHD